MESATVCPRCKAELPAGSKDGLCPRCVLSQVLQAPTDSFGGVNIAFKRGSDAHKSSRVIGDYEIIEELDRGGMGIVYRARQRSLNRIVALKMITAGQFAASQELRRFKLEAEAAAHLDHPNIVPIYEIGAHDGSPFYTMKLIEGGNLESRITGLVEDPRRAAKLMADLARAIHFAHQHGILHRDIKPANVLFDSQEIPHVTDFGLAKLVESSDQGLTQSGVAIGTPSYMSPEQASGQNRNLTTASDVFSLGVILYQMLTGSLPFIGDSTFDILAKVRQDDPVRPREKNYRIDRDLEIICLKCLRKEPRNRYDSAQALAGDLERWLRGEPIHARAATHVERFLKWTRRRPAAALSALLAVALIGAIAGAFWHNSAQKERAEAQKIAERQKRADDFTNNGEAALKAALSASSSAAAETHLIDAEDQFRSSLVENPEHEGAKAGLRAAALRHFELAMIDRYWRQAREKLLLARGAGLADAEFQKLSAKLDAKANERANFLRHRIEELMQDAASVQRKIRYEAAALELISMKDPVTADRLLRYVDDPNPDCRKLAIAALMWYGDPRAVQRILPYIQRTTPDGVENPMDVQESAINAICVLAADDDVHAYKEVYNRLRREKSSVNSLLMTRVAVYYNPFTLRMAAKAEKTIDIDNADEWLDQGNRYNEAHQWQRALECFNKALEFKPNSDAVLLGRGIAKRGLRDLDGAIADYSAALKIKPGSAGAYSNRGVAYREKDDRASAMRDFDKALELNPRDTSAAVNRGLLKFESSDYKGSIKDAALAIQSDPLSSKAFSLRGEASLRLNDFNGCIADFSRVLELTPRAEYAYYCRATAHYRKGAYDEAQSDITRAIELSPANADMWLFQASIKFARGDYRGTFSDADRALKLNPNNKSGCLYRGIALYELGRNDEALADLDEAVAAFPANMMALRTRGCTKRKMGDRLGALDDFKKALSVMGPEIPKSGRDEIEGWIRELEKPQ